MWNLCYPQTSSERGPHSPETCSHPVPVQDPVSGRQWESLLVHHRLILWFRRSARGVGGVSASLLQSTGTRRESRPSNQLLLPMKQAKSQSLVKLLRGSSSECLAPTARGLSYGGGNCVAGLIDSEERKQRKAFFCMCRCRSESCLLWDLRNRASQPAIPALARAPPQNGSPAEREVVRATTE